MTLFVVAFSDSILVVVFDTTIFILTIFRTWKLFQDQRAITKNWKDSLAVVLIRDGLFQHFHGISI